MNAALFFLLFYLPSASAGPQSAAESQDIVRVPEKGAAVMEYRRSPVPFKPYVAALRTPAGVNVLRDNVEDHPHHHGLMFAWRVDGVEFWGETKDSGLQWPSVIEECDTLIQK